MFKKYLKPKSIKYLGEFIDALFTSLPFFSIYSSISLTIILYAQVKDWLIVWLPWVNLWIFLLIVGFAFTIAFFLAYKYIIPSLWSSRSKRMTHLEQKLDVIIEGMGKGQSKGKVVVGCASGGVDPLHPGHLDYIEDAFNYVDYLIFILTRDDQLIEKDRLAGKVKNRLPIPYDVRKATLEWGLGDRGKVVMNIDKDITSCMSLRRYKPDKFLKGGNSWDVNNLPEKAICDELGIEIVFGVGGYDKPYSSSELSGINYET